MRNTPHTYTFKRTGFSCLALKD